MFVDGVLVPELSDLAPEPGVRISSLAAALGSGDAATIARLGIGPAEGSAPKAWHARLCQLPSVTATFKEFNDQVEKLPIDQNCLIALCAPQPVLLSNAVEDTWANPDGQFEVLRAADPVYRLLKAGGLEARERPETGKLIDSTLGYFIRPGEHSMTRADWKMFLDFADKHLGKP